VPGIIKTNITMNAFKGDGSLHGKMEKVQSKGMSPDRCAKKMIRAIAKGKEEVLIGGPEIYSIHLRRFFPAFFSRIIRNHPVKRISKFFRSFVKNKKKGS
jgi:short-subunit dehydrogenase